MNPPSIGTPANRSAATETRASEGSEQFLLRLRRRTGGPATAGMVVALAIPLATVWVLALGQPAFASWRPALVPVTLVALSLAAYAGLRWSRRFASMRSEWLQVNRHGLTWLDHLGRSRSADRSRLRVRFVREDMSHGDARRLIPRCELVGEDDLGEPLAMELSRWTVVGSAGGPRWNTETLAQRLAGWVEHGDLDHPDPEVTRYRVPRRDETKMTKDIEETEPASWLDAAAPRWLRWSWYLIGLSAPVVSWFWLRARIGDPDGDPSLERALASFFILFVTLLILQPVIGRVMRSRLEMLLVLLGPAVSLGIPRLVGGVPLDDGRGTPAWLLWLVDLGTVHLLTVFLAFAVIAYVASFTTGAARDWDREMLSVFVVRSVAALVFFVPALLYGRLLVVETLEVLDTGAWWLLFGWVFALLSETGTVVRRMVREAVL